jgi:hypothetical protein
MASIQQSLWTQFRIIQTQMMVYHEVHKFIQEQAKTQLDAKIKDTLKGPVTIQKQAISM